MNHFWSKNTTWLKQVSRYQVRSPMPERKKQVYSNFASDKFDDTKVLIRTRKSMKGRQYNGYKKKGQSDKQQFTKNYTENKRSRNTNSTKYWEITHV